MEQPGSSPQPDPLGDGAGPAATGARRLRWWMPVAALGAVIVVGAGIALVLFLAREEPEARGVGDAVDDFRSSTTEAAGPGDSAAGPPPGVYLLDGEGREAISFPPVEQVDGSTMPMTITAGADGCWSVRIDYNEAHWQDWQLCAEGTAVNEDGGHTSQRWDFGAVAVENLSTFTCDPPVPFVVLDADPGTVLERSCTGTNQEVAGTTTTAGTVTVLGVETVDVGGERLEVMHVRRHNDLSGAQTGTEDLELWVSTANGLPVRGERSVRVDSDSPVGTITYTEEGTWQLRSSEPQR